jgi:hypothetical protein
MLAVFNRSGLPTTTRFEGNTLHIGMSLTETEPPDGLHAIAESVTKS